MARPKNTQSIIDAIKRHGQKKRDGYKNIDTLAKGLWYNALPKREDGSIAYNGEGKMDLKAAQFITTMIDGKPVEHKQVRHDIFAHYPQAEKQIDVDKFDKTIEVEAEVEH
jgi:hypothetical protein